MTPKERANELYSKYDDLLNKDFGNPIVFHNQLKQCALIAVDEIIDRLMWHTGASDLGNTIIVEDIRYLMDVKQEIENL